MNGIIVNFRQGRHTRFDNHMIVKPEGCSSKEDAEKLVGKKVVFNTGKKDMAGKVSGAHGNKGAVRVIFETGMPGQSLGQVVKIE